ncbi:hypothetical protein CEXT_710201 [Caerostris extrusa]|uniref:Uncharacterized protein n=1 Tax=Caerostris extrusa TaxID=172846 RepID=A0AAV4NUV6_CAEEX|nr:hypothetical protein CEXT_710201 [Caerostris extrusa]
MDIPVPRHRVWWREQTKSRSTDPRRHVGSDLKNHSTFCATWVTGCGCPLRGGVVRDPKPSSSEMTLMKKISTITYF